MIDEYEDWIDARDEVFVVRQSKWIALVILLIVLAFVIGLLLTTGCVTLAKKEYHIQFDTPTPTPEVTIPYFGSTETPTPEPVPTMPYDLWKWSTKQYNMSEWYVIERLNISGTQGTVLKATVYRIKEMPNYYTWEWNWGGPTDGSADWANVPKRGNKFVFVWVDTYIANEGPNNGVKLWGIDANHVVLDAGGNYYHNKNNQVDLTAPIREFENTYDYFDTTRTGPYGYKIIQNMVGGSGEISASPEAWLYPGISNRWDGWILFEVPADTDLSNCRVLMDFMDLAKPAYWTMQPGAGYFN